MVKIISDSTCDLSKDLLSKYDVSLLPLHVLLGTEEYLDGVNISIQEIYDWADASKTTPTTSAPSLEAAIMAKEGKNGGEIVSRIEALKPKVRSSFVVDTLVYLHRGGRCSGLAAMAGETEV